MAAPVCRSGLLLATALIALALPDGRPPLGPLRSTGAAFSARPDSTTPTALPTETAALPLVLLTGPAPLAHPAPPARATKAARATSQRPTAPTPSDSFQTSSLTRGPPLRSFGS